MHVVPARHLHGHCAVVLFHECLDIVVKFLAEMSASVHGQDAHDILLVERDSTDKVTRWA